MILFAFFKNNFAVMFDLFQLMTELGNELVNGILEAKVDVMSTKKPTPQSSRYIVLILMVLCLFVLC